MSDLSDTIEEVWKRVYETSIGADSVFVRPSHNNNHLNLYIHREGNASIIEIPNTPLYNRSDNPQLVGV